MHRSLAILTLVVVPVAGSEASSVPARPLLPSVRVGAVEGTLEMRPDPPRRTASRYPAAAARHPTRLQELPAVVYLKGRVPGGTRPAIPPVMAQQDTSFVPGVLVVQVGDTVEFPNHDPFFHNVFSYSSAARFDLGRYPEGESKTAVMTDVGTVKVYCEVHSSMRGVIIVTENRFHAVVGEDGSFRLDGIPPGTYTLVGWHVDKGETEQQVTVPDGGTARVTLRLG